MVELRKTAESAGQQVGFDPHTKIVSVGNQQFTPQQLQGMGGQIVNERWHLPQQAMQSIIPQQAPPAHISQQGGWNQQQAMSDMQSFIQQQSVGFLQQQQAQLQIMMESQIAQLKMAYEQAIADGQISIRDAEAQFQQQVKQIQQQAYLDAERTALYGHDMGIQNSQQMVGLMQGDNARKNSMINENMTTRDRRINDIKDRLNAIKTQKNIDMARVIAEYDHGMLRAQGEANQMFANNMFGLMQNDYFANRDQRFTQDNMRLGDELQRGQMMLGQEFTRENMATQFDYALKQATHESGLAIERMNVQHGLDLAKMAQALKDDIQKMSISFGHQSSLQSQAHKQSLARMEAEYKKKIEAEEKAYRTQLARDLRGITPGTQEYKVITANHERQFKNNLTQIHLGTVYEYTTQQILQDAPATAPKKPTDFILGKYDSIGNLLNWITGFNKKNDSYNAQMEAIKRRDEMMNSVTPYLPWSK